MPLGSDVPYDTSAGVDWRGGGDNGSQPAHQPRLSLAMLMAVFLMLLALTTIFESGGACYHSLMSLSGP